MLFSTIRLLLFLTTVVSISACSIGTPSGQNLVLTDQPEREIKVLVAYGSGVSKEAGHMVVGRVAARLKEQANVTLITHEVENHLDSTPTRSLSTFLRGWKKALGQKGEEYDIIHLFLPMKSVVPASSENALGYAEGIGVAGRIPDAFSYTRLTGDLDTDTWSMLHEFGHLLGAEHASTGIMRDDRLPEELYFSADSLVSMFGDKNRMARFVSYRKRPQLAFTSFKSF